MSALQLLINDALQNGTLILTKDAFPVSEQVYQCVCGKSAKRDSLRRHLKTKSHLAFMETHDAVQYESKEGEECCICYDAKTEWYECGTCHQKHCMECHSHPSVNRCPLCRADFPPNVSLREELVAFQRQTTNMMDIIDSTWETDENDQIGAFSETLIELFFSSLIARKHLLDQLPDLKETLLGTLNRITIGNGFPVNRFWSIREQLM